MSNTFNQGELQGMIDLITDEFSVRGWVDDILGPFTVDNTEKMKVVAKVVAFAIEQQEA